jgi:GxxExxY protein
MEKNYENDLSYTVRGILYDVYKELGPGLLEAIYVKAICRELTNKNLKYATEVAVVAMYKGENLGIGYRLDILIEDTLVLEVKSIELLADVHFKQLLTYLRLPNKKIGLLVNFKTDDITKSIHRKVNKI